MAKAQRREKLFMIPNEIFGIGLDHREISLYTYLLRCENRETYQCYPSYKTIGKAIGMSENTVAKYVRQLEEKGLIYTEPTMVRSKDGRPLNGNLLYTIRPVHSAVEAFYERQLRQVEEDNARYRTAQLLEKSSTQSRQNALCTPFQEEPSPSPAQKIEDEFEPLSEEQRNDRFFALLGGNEGCGACDDAKQDKGKASQAPPQPPLLPAVRAVSEMRGWRL